MFWTAMHASCKCCLTSIRVLIVSGFKLERCRDIVSRPPKKMCSTATAEPKIESGISWMVFNEHKWCTRDGSISQVKQDKLGNCVQCPAHHWIVSQFSKYSSGSLKNSSSSSMSNQGHCLYREVKLTFWGEADEGAGAEDGGTVTDADWWMYCSRKRAANHSLDNSRWLLRETSSPQSARRPWYEICGSSTVGV